MIKKILAFLVAFGIFGAIAGLYQFSKTNDKIADLKVDATLSSTSLFDEFNTDETAANTKYLDKIIEVSGKVVSAENKNDQSTIYLETDDMMGTVLCQLERKSDKLPEKGTNVSIKGICSGFLTDVVLVRSMIINK